MSSRPNLRNLVKPQKAWKEEVQTAWLGLRACDSADSNLPPSFTLYTSFWPDLVSIDPISTLSGPAFCWFVHTVFHSGFRVNVLSTILSSLHSFGRYFLCKAFTASWLKDTLTPTQVVLGSKTRGQNVAKLYHPNCWWSDLTHLTVFPDESNYPGECSDYIWS